MPFTDAHFLFLFLPLALLVHRLALGAHALVYGRPVRLAIFLLTLIFYAFGQLWWLAPFLVCIGFDFTWASLLHRIQTPRYRRLILALSVMQNLTLLALFKYWHFLAANLVSVLPQWRGPLSYVSGVLPTALPPGISFYVFESLSFVIDVYTRRVQPPKKPDEFFAFIGMFPRFVAGPIVRYRDMVGQFANYRGMKVQAGLTVFAVGLFFKCCFADNFALFVPFGFDATAPVDFYTAWFSTVAYAMQIYFDFYGYSLMAIGLGLCLGFRFPNNFNRPYLAGSLQDFWRRWHISLSTWLRDYLYIPLGGSQKGVIRTYVNLFLTMLIGGLWHGANWTFIAWGALHGGWLCVERLCLGGFPPIPKRLLTLLVVLVGWVFFRADTMAQARGLLSVMLNPPEALDIFHASAFLSLPGPLFCCLAGLLYCFAGESQIDASAIESLEIPTRWQVAAAFILFAGAVPIGSPDIAPTPFLYFQF